MGRPAGGLPVTPVGIKDRDERKRLNLERSGDLCDGNVIVPSELNGNTSRPKSP